MHGCLGASQAVAGVAPIAAATYGDYYPGKGPNRPCVDEASRVDDAAAAFPGVGNLTVAAAPYVGAFQKAWLELSPASTIRIPSAVRWTNLR